MTTRASAPLVEAHDRTTWRAWLEANHASTPGAWLVTWRSATGRPTLAYEDAVEEALCFGWVDSMSKVLDAERGQLWFAPRKGRSPWAATNKARVARLIADGLMRPAGLRVIERAKANGDWEILDSVERLEVPDDLAAALAAAPPAADRFAGFPPSVRKQHLAWVATAVKPETRAQRIGKVAAAAARNERAVG